MSLLGKYILYKALMGNQDQGHSHSTYNPSSSTHREEPDNTPREEPIPVYEGCVDDAMEKNGIKGRFTLDDPTHKKRVNKCRANWWRITALAMMIKPSPLIRAREMK